ncbi:hypothetical protein LIER_21038 [Lithospermum erythrorhizon]|uniref:Uncharacterized protein n=1 Tax=Lithospermum erythrorhizon TaxID=34254 RepID=A0AAV3QRS0_LITER
MEADLSRVQGNLNLEGEEMDEVVIPVMAFEMVDERFQFSLVGKVLTSRRFNVRPLKSLSRLSREDADIGIAIGAHIGEVLEVDKRSIEQERGTRYDDAARNMSRINKFDPWMFVHGERRLQNNRRGRFVMTNNLRGMVVKPLDQGRDMGKK